MCLCSTALRTLPDDVRSSFCRSLAEFLDGLVSHYVLDDSKLIVAHAGMKEEMRPRLGIDSESAATTSASSIYEPGGDS